MFKFAGVIILLRLVSVSTDPSDDSVALNLEDNAIDGKFSSFAKINVRLSRPSSTELVPTRTISPSPYERLTKELRSNSHPYYTLKVSFKRQSSEDYVMTSVPMCLVLQAQFQYQISLSVNENGYLVSAHLITNNSTCTFSNVSALEASSDLSYKVSLRLQSNNVGPQPEVQHFLEKLKREKEARLNAQENDNRPFIVKYWKYLLPVVIIFVLQGAFTDTGNGGGR